MRSALTVKSERNRYAHTQQNVKYHSRQTKIGLTYLKIYLGCLFLQILFNLNIIRKGDVMYILFGLLCISLNQSPFEKQ